MIETFKKFEDKQVKLTKTSMKDYSMVKVGDSVTGNMTLLEYGNELMLYVSGKGFYDMIKTSPVQEIISNDDKMIKFKTVTSTYELLVTGE
jgi:hypothetical protein